MKFTEVGSIGEYQKKPLKTLFYRFPLISDQIFLHTKKLIINNYLIAQLNKYVKLNNKQKCGLVFICFFLYLMAKHNLLTDLTPQCSLFPKSLFFPSFDMMNSMQVKSHERDINGHENIAKLTLM